MLLLLFHDYKFSCVHEYLYIHFRSWRYIRWMPLDAIVHTVSFRILTFDGIAANFMPIRPHLQCVREKQ